MIQNNPFINNISELFNSITIDPKKGGIDEFDVHKKTDTIKSGGTGSNIIKTIQSQQQQQTPLSLAPQLITYSESNNKYAGFIPPPLTPETNLYACRNRIQSTVIKPIKHAESIRVENIVYACNTGCDLNLRELHSNFNNKFGSQYNPKKFAAVIIRFRLPKVAILVFQHNGRIVCTGSKNPFQARYMLGQIVRSLIEMGYKDASLGKMVLQNMVASVALEFCVNLALLSQENSSFCTYIPELFPGVIMKHPELNCALSRKCITVLVFKSGRMVITGAKATGDVKRALMKVIPVVKKFKVPKPNSTIIMALIDEEDKKMKISPKKLASMSAGVISMRDLTIANSALSINSGGSGGGGGSESGETDSIDKEDDTNNEMDLLIALSEEGKELPTASAVTTDNMECIEKAIIVREDDLSLSRSIKKQKRTKNVDRYFNERNSMVNDHYIKKNAESMLNKSITSIPLPAVVIKSEKKRNIDKISNDSKPTIPPKPLVIQNMPDLFNLKRSIEQMNIPCIIERIKV